MWRYMVRGSFQSVAETRGFIREALNELKLGDEVPFAMLTPDGQLVGSTRYLDIRRSRNLAPMSALEAVGAAKEGVLRRHRRMQDGFLRNTVYFSVLDNEWPEMRRCIEMFLGIAPW